MSEQLAQVGLFVDDFNKLRIVDPVISQDTSTLKDLSSEYLDKVSTFRSIVENTLSMIDSVSRTVEKQKMKTIVLRNKLVSMERQRQLEQQKVDLEIQWQKDENDRLQAQLHSLQKEEADQNEFVERFLMGR